MRFFALLTLLLLTACASTSNIPSSGTGFSLDGCTPFLNCVSSTSSVGLYRVEPIQLSGPLDEPTWDAVKAVATEMPGASLNDSRYGYLDMTFYSDLLGFPDYFEVLVSEDRESLDVRSQSLVGFYDLGVNRRRVERFRHRLVEGGVATARRPDSEVHLVFSDCWAVK
ncbi:DUF1499 domain-containing protein [Marinobacter sp.]|uniref:DUF1499 domain-containing protein n=1 Tax=Marinobacter sp. TaxID=50741 RepID=UPI00384E1AE5